MLIIETCTEYDTILKIASPLASNSEELVSFLNCIVDTTPLTFTEIFICIDPEKLPFQPNLDSALNIYNKGINY